MILQINIAMIMRMVLGKSIGMMLVATGIRMRLRIRARMGVVLVILMVIM